MIGVTHIWPMLRVEISLVLYLALGRRGLYRVGGVL